MAKYTAVLDACVLYPAMLRNVLMWLAVNDVFKAKWTEQIQDEWIYHLLENCQDLDPAKLD